MNENNRRSQILALADELLVLLRTQAGRRAVQDQSALSRQYVLTIQNIEAFRQKVADGQLPLDTGAGIGLTKALGEWAPEEIYMAGHRLETLFMGISDQQVPRQEP